MAHEKVYGICENKCRVPVYPKEQTYSQTEVDAKFSELSNRIAQLEKESAQWGKDIGALQENVTDLYGQISSLDQRVTNLGG